jgi:putative colanic acid biosynthesis acetyltransferase WcaF
VTVGELCVVGARSVVVRDLPPRKICVGQPCRPVRDRAAPRSA